MALGLVVVRLPFPRQTPGPTGMVILGSAGDRVVVPYTPNESDTDGLAPTYAIIDRPQRMPLVQRTGPGLPTWSLELLYQKPDYTDHVDIELLQLANLVRNSETVTVSRGPGGGGIWRITGFAVHVLALTGADNHVAEATVALAFTRASDAHIATGPVAGGVGKPAAPLPAGAPATPAAGAARTHTVVRGDTLYALAIKYCGTGAKWTAIADANGVKDPRKLRIGQALRIPC